MNEPSVFNSEEITMSPDCLHFDGENYVQHFEVHNLYGYFYHKVTYEALRQRYKNTIRPFVLSRSFYSGSQKYGFIWTGDNRTTKESMKYSIHMIITISLSGLSACGADVGGFFGNPSAELMRDWFKLGVFYPFFRGHSHCESIRREPWCFDEETLTSMRESISLRYKLLLFWYTKFYQHSVTGIPILRPVWMKFKQFCLEIIHDKTYEDLFLVGDEILVLPNINEGECLIPEIMMKLIFYDLITGEVYQNKSHIEKRGIFSLVIGGSIIPWYDKVG
jgi:alpha 1,3-glucosidase